MKLELTEEQQMLAESVDKLLQQRYDASTRLELLRSETGWSRDMWKRYADLGVLGLHYGENVGGAGMTVDEVAVVMESFGKALILEPYIGSIVLAGRLVELAGTDAQQQEILPQVTSGDLLLAFADREPGDRDVCLSPTTKAQRNADGWSITGKKVGVLGADVADGLVVSASVDGELGLFYLQTSEQAVRRFSYPQQDGLGAADVIFDDAPAQRLDNGDATAAIHRVVQEATALLCAEAVGAMSTAMNLTVDYLKTRKQFGVALSTFQALQHRAADMYVSMEQARSMAVLARLALDHDDAEQGATMLHAARVQIDLSARHIGQEAIQMHGGIGVTMEYPVGHYVKRLTVISKTFGDTDSHLAAVTAAGGLV